VKTVEKLLHTVGKCVQMPAEGPKTPKKAYFGPFQGFSGPFGAPCGPLKRAKKGPFQGLFRAFAGAVWVEKGQIRPSLREKNNPVDGGPMAAILISS